VSDNKLESVPEELGLIPSLTHLKLRHNSLTWVSAKLSHLPHLQELDLVNNRHIANLPPEMTREETPARAVLRYLSSLVPEPPQQDQQRNAAAVVAPMPPPPAVVVTTPGSSYRTPRLARSKAEEQEAPEPVANVPPASELPPPVESFPSRRGWLPDWLLPAAAGAGAVLLLSLWMQRMQRRR
jgi:Leucine-rich repeat (LRR) protein